jgi:hypothetical protein
MIMPRLEFEEPKGGPLSKAAQDEQQDDELSELLAEDEPEGGQPDRSRQPSRDTVLVVLKGVTVAVVIALIGVVILLATSSEKPAAKSPSVPTIPEGSSQTSAGPTTSTSVGAIIAPEVHTQTTEIVPVPPPVTESTLPTNEPPRPGQDEFVRIGEPCDTPGAYAFTESFEPVVCDSRGPGDRLAWRRIFR